MKTKVFVDGQDGTTGLRINEYLAKREDVEVLRIDADRRKDVEARRSLLNEADVAFLCLPDAAAKESAAMAGKNTCVIDASTAHRCHPDWAYGLPELAPEYRQKIRSSKRIANPGCHATAFILLAHPLVKHGIISPETALQSFSITGYSGGGKKMIADYQAGTNDKLTSPRPYSLGLTHKHLPEMKMHTGLTAAPIFVPVVSNFYKGLAVSIFLHPTQCQRSIVPADLQAMYEEYYGGEQFVRVLPWGDEANLDAGNFDVQACNDTNRVDIAVFGNAERMVLIAREDNLGKGASGAAIQSMNAHLGLDEAVGL